jgi:hypothetical protein
MKLIKNNISYKYVLLKHKNWKLLPIILLYLGSIIIPIIFFVIYFAKISYHFDSISQVNVSYFNIPSQISSLHCFNEITIEYTRFNDTTVICGQVCSFHSICEWVEELNIDNYIFSPSVLQELFDQKKIGELLLYDTKRYQFTEGNYRFVLYLFKKNDTIYLKIILQPCASPRPVRLSRIFVRGRKLQYKNEIRDDFHKTL